MGWKQNEVLNARAHHELFPAIGKVPGLRHGMQPAQRLPAIVPRARNVPCACSRNGLPYLHHDPIRKTFEPQRFWDGSSLETKNESREESEMRREVVSQTREGCTARNHRRDRGSSGWPRVHMERRPILQRTRRRWQKVHYPYAAWRDKESNAVTRRAGTTSVDRKRGEPEHGCK